MRSRSTRGGYVRCATAAGCPMRCRSPTGRFRFTWSRCRQRAAHRVHDRAAPARADVSAHRMRPHQMPGSQTHHRAGVDVRIRGALRRERTERDGQRRDHHPHLERRLRQRQHRAGRASGRLLRPCCNGTSGACRSLSPVVPALACSARSKRRGEETLSDITGPLPVTAIAVPRPGHRWNSCSTSVGCCCRAANPVSSMPRSCLAGSAAAPPPSAGMR